MRLWLGALGLVAVVACGSDRPPPGGGPAPVCVGARPEASAWGAIPGPLAQGGGSATGGTGGGGGSLMAGPTFPGAPTPSYALEDVQPKSCGFGAVYGLSSFEGKVTVVALLSGWCPYCQAQATGLEAMRRELLSQGHDVGFVIVNSTDAIADQAELTSRCDFAVLQDLETVQAWALHHQAKKDDILVYDAAGVLHDFFPAGGERTTNLEASQGRENLRQAILGAAE